MALFVLSQDMPKYDYKCPQGHTEEHLVRDMPETLPCYCGEKAVRQYPYNQCLRFGPDPYERDYREMEANGEFD